MVGDGAFIRPTKGPLLLFWDVSWVQSERAADRLGLICALTHIGYIGTNTPHHIQKNNVDDMLLSCQSNCLVFQKWVDMERD